MLTVLIIYLIIGFIGWTIWTLCLMAISRLSKEEVEKSFNELRAKNPHLQFSYSEMKTAVSNITLVQSLKLILFWPKFILVYLFIKCGNVGFRPKQ